MRAERKLSVVMPTRNEWALTKTGGLLERVLKEIPSGYNSQIIVCANNSDQDFVDKLLDIGTQEERIKILDLGITHPLNWSYAYLYGLKSAFDTNADFIVEMDSNGAHDPIYIRDFLDVLDRKSGGAAFSTRFGKEGKIKNYPLQRQLISRSGTIAANLVLGFGQWINDMTSGYEAFKKNVLGDVLSVQPIEKWISVTKGPGHFYQTEMRATVLWRKHNVDMVPITWGAERVLEPEHLPFKTVTGALQRLIELKIKQKDLQSR